MDTDAINAAIDWVRLQLLEHGHGLVLEPPTLRSQAAAARRNVWILDYAQHAGVPIPTPPVLDDKEADALLDNAPSAMQRQQRRLVPPERAM
jgi:hypothetical protein